MDDAADGDQSGGPPRIPFPFFHARGGYSVGAFFARLLPAGLARFVGGSISLAYAWLQPARLAAVRRNLALVHARRISAAEGRAVFWEFGRTIADYFLLADQPAIRAMARVSEHVGFEHFEMVRRLGRGGLLLTPHLSFFELGGAAAHAHGFEIVALTRPESSPGLTAWRADYRARWGVQTLEIGSDDPFVFVDVARQLDAGRLVAALVDRPNATQTSRVALPGGFTEFSGAILLLALSRECPVIPVTTNRLADGTFRVEAHAPFFIERQGRDTAALLEFYCQRLADVFVPVIRDNSRQWFHFVPVERP